MESTLKLVMRLSISVTKVDIQTTKSSHDECLSCARDNHHDHVDRSTVHVLNTCEANNINEEVRKIDIVIGLHALVISVVNVIN